SGFSRRKTMKLGPEERAMKVLTQRLRSSGAHLVPRSATITLVVTPTKAGSTSIQANVLEGDAFDTNLSNTPGMATTTVLDSALSSADLDVTISVDPSPVILGSNLTYTVAVTNHVPKGVTFEGFTFVTTGAICLLDNVANTISCNLGNPTVNQTA